jgi:hypothetical protein
LTVSAGERRWPISIVCGLRIAHWISELISGGIVAEKSDGVAFPRNFLDDAAHVGKETHVEHAVRFIEHQELNVLKVAGSLLDVIEQTPRRGDDDVGAVLQCLSLAAVPHAAENDGEL